MRQDVPMRQDVVDRIRGVIAEVKGIPLETVKPESTFDDLAIDSLDGFNVLFELEKAFDISIPDQEAKEIHSVAEAAAGIERLLAAGPGAATGP